MIRHLTAPGPDGRPGDVVKLLAYGPEAVLSAEGAVGDACEVVAANYGDIWLRDIGPIFYSNDRCAVFEFNGWGDKFVYDHDDTVGEQVAALAHAEPTKWHRVLEGGALDWDGEGTALTTRECLLNPNRNPQLDEAGYEKLLADALGIRKLIWIDEGLKNDHTDGHVDNIARFVAPGVVVCQSPSGPDDPHAERIEAVARQLEGQRDARGRVLQVVRIPSPGRVIDQTGDVVPASHVNFIIGNAAVVVPTYGTGSAEAAVEALAKLFPGRKVVGSPAKHILTGGGAFHCITQQQPA